MTVHLLTLSEELLCEITSLLGTSDLRALRLTCKQLVSAATFSLFTSVVLYPDARSVGEFQEFLGRDALRNLVREVELNTLRKNQVEMNPEIEEPSSGFITACKDIKNFPKITMATLRFSRPLSLRRGEDDYSSPWSNRRPSMNFRRHILRLFFDVLAHHTASRVKDVCIANIQNVDEEEFMQSATVRNVLCTLTALRLYVLGTEMVDLHTFMDELPSSWLSPAASNLTTLVLYQDSHFGYYPKLDLREVHLPRLRTLALGRYTFTHDWQLDWLHVHAPTLENLFFDDCAIIWLSRHHHYEDADGYPTKYPTVAAQHNVNAPFTCRTFDLTWSRIFERLLHANDSRLRHFRIGFSPRWNDDSCRRGCFDTTTAAHERMDVRLVPNRYLRFDGYSFILEILNNPVVVRLDPNQELDPIERALEGFAGRHSDDLAALRELLAEIGQPVDGVKLELSEV